MAISKKVGNKTALKSSIASGNSYDEMWRPKADETAEVRFLTDPDEWSEFGEHYDDTIQDGTRYIPCIGRDEGCVYCLDGKSPSKKWLANVVDLSQSKVRALVFGVSVAKYLWGRWDKANTIMDRAYEISRTGSGLDTEYEVDHQTPSKFKASRYELLDLEDVLRSIVDGAGNEEADDEPTWASRKSSKKAAKKSAKKSSVKASARRSRDEDEDDEDDEDPPPRKSVKKALRSAVKKTRRSMR